MDFWWVQNAFKSSNLDRINSINQPLTVKHSSVCINDVCRFSLLISCGGDYANCYRTPGISHLPQLGQPKNFRFQNSLRYLRVLLSLPSSLTLGCLEMCPRAGLIAHTLLIFSSKSSHTPELVELELSKISQVLICKQIHEYGKIHTTNLFRPFILVSYVFFFNLLFLKIFVYIW